MPLKPIKGPASYPCPPGFNGRLAGAYRWFSGRPLNGHRYTDATYRRRATMATDISGHASAYQRLAGWERFLWFRAPVMAAPAGAVGVWLATWWQLLIVLAMATAVTVKIMISQRHVRGHRREVVEPMAMAVARLVNARHVDGHGHKSVDIPMDIRDNPRATVTIRLPVHWTGEDSERKRLAALVSRRLSMDDLVMSMDMTGQAPVATFEQTAKLPTSVGMMDMATPAIADTELAMGLGVEGAIVAMSLALESPHVAIAGGSGAGKSELIAFLVGQLMRRGYGVAVLDAKFTSHMWARRVPGILYASESEELHEALLWLDGEVMRRARHVAAGGDQAALTPLVAVLEEMTGASNRLRAYWGTIKQTGDPMMSPALTALANVSSMGRELRVHILMAGQSLTGKATGGPENRENFGARALARATQKQWAMLAPQIKPAPIKRNKPGRWHLVVGDSLKEFQAPFMDLKGHEARLIEWATGGAQVPDVPAMMLAGGPVVAAAEKAENASSEPATTLRDYASARGLELANLRSWLNRSSTAPAPVRLGEKGAGMYSWEDLDLFVISRGGVQVE